MQDRIEPPILISRLMTFVMATSLVVLVVLIITLDKMFPLNRPQVFFLTSETLEDRELTLTEIPDDSLEDYKQQFIREYVRERNEIVPNLSIMRALWADSPDGVIKTRSTDEVFGKFAMTDMVNIITRDRDLDESFNINCTVEFPPSKSVVPKTGETNTYIVTFMYKCNDGSFETQEILRPYTLSIELESTAQNAVKWAERMENPLGIRVSGYNVINKEGKVINDDPLNWLK